MSAVVIPGRNYVSQAERIAQRLNCMLIKTHYKEFPDGEQYVRIEPPEQLKSRKALIINTMYPWQDRSLVEILMLVDAAMRAGAESVHLIIPYIAYSRQDKIFLPGEPVSFSLVLRALKSMGARSLLTVDVHNPERLSEFEGFVENILVSDLLVAEAIDIVSNPVVIAPDKGALKRAEFAARKLGLKFDYLIKTRDRVTGRVSYQPREVEIKGENVVMVDDIISTGGTMAEASRLLLDKGAASIVIAATHGLMIGNALEKIKAAGVKKVLLADTLGIRLSDPLIEYIDITNRLSDAIKEMVEKVE
ncbi:MAG: ribose-phosphate diphosphokinase [Thermosphaera sp.]